MNAFNGNKKMIKNVASKDMNCIKTVRNSWIICRSKSYPGRIYYFNTESGEAAWNLSDAEVEKAKKTTLESVHKLKLTEFPEPLESPQDYDCNEDTTNNKPTLLQNIAQPKIYNKQVINNKFTRPPQPSTSFGHFAQFNSLNPMGFGIPAFAPLVNVPANSIFLAPSINTIQPNVDPNYNCVQNNQALNAPLAKGFQGFQNKNSRPPFNAKIFNKRNIFQNKNTQNMSNDTMDLRQKLMNMRNRKQNICSTVPRGLPYPLFSNSVMKCEEGAIEENEINTTEPDLSDTFPDELINEIDVTALKGFFGVNPSAEYLFIVVDEDVLLNHINYMIKLIQVDEQLRLVIPQVVLLKIQRLTTSVHNKASLQAASFISEALESNVAVIDEENYGTDDYYENIFSCCLKLLNQNYDVVFISEKDMSSSDFGFPSFTMKDIKTFLVDRKVKEDPKITITIPNDSRDENILSNDDPNETLEVKPQDIYKDSKGSQFPPSTKDACIQTEQSTKTFDVAVQVDSDYCKSENSNEPTKKPERRHRLIRRPLFKSTVKTNEQRSDVSCTTENRKVLLETATNTSTHVQAINTNVPDNTMIFQITSKSMEEYLRMRSDEWVSRFVQIMEEALTQILQQDPSIVLDMPPPWTIYEASECIKRKYSHDCDVLDAASKLSNILFEMGGLRGKINNNIHPEVYMKMYSYGYCLVDSLQSLIRNNEDLQIAGTSLIKLLSDIQNPHLDPSNSDSFTDLESTRQNESSNININKSICNEKSKVISQKPILTESTQSKNDTLSFGFVLTDLKTLTKEPNLSKNIQSQEITIDSSPNKAKIIRKSPKVNKEEVVVTTSPQQRKYNLRNKKPSNQDENENKANEIVLKHLCPKDSFLTKLNLVNKKTEINDNTTDTINDMNPVNGHSFDDKQTEGPKVMRNFTVCPEFEKRLQNNSITFTEDFSDDLKLDYENFEESVTSEPDDTKENEKDTNYNVYCTAEETSFKSPESFRHFLDEVGTKVKESFLKVYSFCENSRNKLITSSDSKQKLQIRTKAEQMGSFVEKMCLSLKRIFERESNESQETTREILIKMGFESKDIDEKELEYYRNFISRCVVQGNILHQSLKLLIEATLENVPNIEN